MKKAQDNPPPAPRPREFRENRDSGNRDREPQQRRPYSQKADNRDWSKSKTPTENMSFEDMMSKFKQTSDDKMSDLKKYMDVKKGSSNRKQPK